MKKSFIIMLVMLSVLSFTACGLIDSSSDKGDETETITTSENDDEAEETTETDTTEDTTTETTAAEITEPEIQTTISEINDVELNNEDYVSLGEFSFPIAEGFTNSGTSGDKNTLYFENEDKTIIITYFNDDISEAVDILKQMADINSAVFSTSMQYNGLYGCFYDSEKDIKNPVICAVAASSDSPNLSGIMPYLMIQPMGFGGYTEAMSAISVTLENIVCDTSNIQPVSSDDSFECPYFSIESDGNWVLGYSDYKIDHDEYFADFYHISDGNKPTNYTAFSADDNPNRMTVDEAAADYLDQDFDDKKTEKIKFMGYDAVQVTLTDSRSRFRYIIFDTGDALITVFTNISIEEYSEISKDSNEFIKNLELN